MHLGLVWQESILHLIFSSLAALQHHLEQGLSRHQHLCDGQRQARDPETGMEDSDSTSPSSFAHRWNSPSIHQHQLGLDSKKSASVAYELAIPTLLHTPGMFPCSGKTNNPFLRHHKLVTPVVCKITFTIFKIILKHAFMIRKFHFKV